MRVTVLLCLVGVCYGTEVVKRQIPFGGGRQVVQRYQGGQQIPQGFRAAPLDDESREEIDRNTVQPTHTPYVQRPQPVQYRQQESRGRPQEYSLQGGKRPLGKPGLKDEELEEEEKEEPDRLTMLLPQSKFNCQGKNTGYYADEGLGCEVFHYCQDNARHSWICPEGFLFHQVHLICMPPSHDNICSSSSQYHFVNDFLYKPLNAEEALTKPNVTIRYSERYYPENYYEEEFGAPQQRAEATPRPQQIQQRPHHPHPHQTQPSFQTARPTQQIVRQPNQVFHSPEEVNIPLQHRRPVPVSQPHRNFQQSSEEYEY